MPFTKDISASTKAMRERKEKPVTKTVTFPSSFEELKAGVGPWKNPQEFFEDAMAHRVVIIQSKMRLALETGEEDADENGKDIPSFKF